MTKRFVVLLLCVAAGSIQIGCNLSREQIEGGRGKTIAIIPRPVMMEVHEGRFNLTPETSIVVTKDTHHTGKYLSKLLQPATGFDFNVAGDCSPAEGGNCIVLRTISDKSRLGPEGYELKVMKDRVLIDARSGAGVFYACQSLRQLLPVEIESKEKVEGVAWFIPCVEIEDTPRFGWRGLMIDCSRTFWRKAYLKRYIDLLAYYKMNVLHLHLTDDQGWRLEIKRHPKLTEVCSRFSDKYNEPPERQGFYTQQDIKDIVSYAAQRHVTIVPEIEMPGHTSEVFAAYPELSCSGRKQQIYPYFRGPGITKDVFCAGNDEVFGFLEDVLSEVVELFPSEYIHIGGDECPKDCWKRCPKCQKRMKEEGLTNENELQSYFVKRIEKFLLSKNRKLIGWDEILEGGLAPEVAVMSWRGTAGGIAAAQQGHFVVMSPTSHCYFDYDNKKFPLKNVYALEPIPSELGPEQHLYILGAQANMWTHISRTEAEVDQQIFARLVALSEVVWSPKELREWSNFRRRLRAHCERLEKLGVNFYRDPMIWGEAPEGR